MELDNKSIIIADYDYTKILYKYKNQYSIKDIKIYQKKDVIDKLSFLYVKDPIYYLINNKNIAYSKAKQLIEYLRIVDLSKNEFLNILYNDLLNNGYIKDNPLSKLEFKGYKIYIFEANEDIEIHSYLDNKGFKYQDISFNDLDIKPKYDIKKDKLKVFENKYYQYFYLFSDVLNRLHDEKEEIDGSRINILVDDEFDLYYAKTISELFNVSIYTSISRKLLEINGVKPIIDEFYNNKKIVINESKDDKVKAINNIIKKYNLNNLDFEYGYLNLIEILSSTTINETLGNSGVTITSKFIFNDSINYITNFKHNSFYTEYSDNQALSDVELKKLSLNTSYDRTRLDRRKKYNYLKYNNIVFLSTIQLHLKDSIFDSQFIEELELKDFKVNTIFNSDGLYPTKAKKILFTNIYDKAFYKKPNSKFDLLTYDNTFKGITNPVYANKEKWYLTNLEAYINCPYKYYLSDLISLKDDDYSARCIGTYIHKFYEKLYHRDFDLEKALIDAENEYKKFYEDKKLEFTNKDKAYIEYLKYWLRKLEPLVGEIKSHTKFSDLNDVKDYELSVDYEIDGYKLSGRIDKIIYAECNQDKIYYIVDYKSGAESFKYKEVHLGKSIQLPLYYYAIENYNQELKRDSKFAGFAIQHSYFKDLKKITKNSKINRDSILKYMIMNGLTCNTKDIREILGSNEFYNYDNGFKNLTSNLIISGKEPYDYSFNECLEESLEATKNTIGKILNNDFEIAPTPLDLSSDSKNNMSCKYCGYRDVCYRKIKDFRFYKEEIEKHFESKVHVEEEDTDNAI